MFKLFENLLNNLKPIRPLHIAFDSGGKHKPTILLLHGIAATSSTWDFLIKDLDTKKYRVVALDLLGFGLSPKPINCKYTVEDHVNYIHRTLRKLNISAPYKIVGHSMGSIISARYCSRYHKGIKEAILLSLPLYLKDSTLHTNISRTQTDFYLNAYQLLSQKKDFTISNSRILRKILRVNDGIEVNEENWNSFRLSLINTIVNQNTYNDIKSLEIPVHIIYGNMDEFLVQDSVNKLSVFNHVKVTKLLAINHAVGLRFAKEVAKLI